MAFASRLTGLLNYYLDCRRFTSFDKLCELLGCGRVKCSLSDTRLQHILSIESASELRLTVIEIID